MLIKLRHYHHELHRPLSVFSIVAPPTLDHESKLCDKDSNSSRQGLRHIFIFFSNLFMHIMISGVITASITMITIELDKKK